MKPAEIGQGGYFQAYRTCMFEVMAANPLAYCLAAVIGARARYSTTFNRHYLKMGEALIGDHQNYGMSEQNYRTAKKFLDKHGFATFKSTNKGTVARLADSRLFSYTLLEGNDQNNGRLTSSQRPPNDRLTSINKDKSSKNNKNMKEGAGEAPRSLSASERITKDRELKMVRDTIKDIRGRYRGGERWAQEDKDRIKGLKDAEMELLTALDITPLVSLGNAHSKPDDRQRHEVIEIGTVEENDARRRARKGVPNI